MHAMLSTFAFMNCGRSFDRARCEGRKEFKSHPTHTTKWTDTRSAWLLGFSEDFAAFHISAREIEEKKKKGFG